AAGGRRRVEAQRSLAGDRSAGWKAVRDAGQSTIRRELGFGLAVDLRGRFEKARQGAPNVTRGFDSLGAAGKGLALHLFAAEPLGEEAAGIVAEPPNDGRAATLVDQSREQRQEQAPADTLVLPVRSDIEREDLAAEPRLAAAAAATAEADDASLRIDRNPH